MKLYIGNLPYDISEPELSDLFTEFGEIVNADLIKDRYTGKSKGFAFVEMDSRSSGQQAMESLNKRIYKSRPLVCNEAKPQKKGNRRR
ncbi:MAG: RNA-binding protein [Desulfofustis sp.]|jgi:RNA recognition motif-containing protein|nr:RNA-binding protein [Desulfofustis sp.]